MRAVAAATASYQPVCDPMETIRTMKEIRPERCIIGTDFGQVMQVNSLDGMKRDEIYLMIRDNPAKLMWLDD
jgi:hypothetical protein